MPADNKPLEMSVLKRVKELLAEVDARTAAVHITMADCTVCKKHAPVCMQFTCEHTGMHVQTKEHMLMHDPMSPMHKRQTSLSLFSLLLDRWLEY